MDETLKEKDDIIQKTIKEIAKKMLLNDFDIDNIIKATGLKRKKVEKIQRILMILDGNQYETVSQYFQKKFKEVHQERLGEVLKYFDLAIKEKDQSEQEYLRKLIIIAVNSLVSIKDNFLLRTALNLFEIGLDINDVINATWLTKDQIIKFMLKEERKLWNI